MFEKLTPRMETVIKLSQEIAREYEQDYVGTEHMLLAILREGTGAGAAVLNHFGISETKAKAVVDKHMKNSMEDTWVFGRLPGTPHFRNVMAAAIEEARQLESKHVCTEHLLLALAREDGSVAQATLHDLGAKAGTLRAEISKRLEHSSKGAESPDSCA